jgi:hypothetical protein
MHKILIEENDCQFRKQVKFEKKKNKQDLAGIFIGIDFFSFKFLSISNRLF